MSLRPLQRQTRQPATPAGVDWSNPLTARLRNLWFMPVGAPFDLVGTAQSLVDNNTPVATSDGVVLSQTGVAAASVLITPQNQYNLPAGSAWSWMFRLATGGSPAGPVWEYGDTNGDLVYITYGGTQTNALLTFYRDISGVTISDIAFVSTNQSLLINSGFHSILVASNGSAVSIFIDGAPVTVSVVGVNDGLISLGTGIVAQAASLFAQSGVKMSFAAFWAADVSRFASQLHRNPWQLFRPANSPIFYSLPSPALGVTLSNATVFNITPVSANPRVTITY